MLDTVWWSPEFAELFGFSPDDTNYTRERLFGLRPVRRIASGCVAIIDEALVQEHEGLRHRFRDSSTRRPANGGGWKRAAAPITPPTAGRSMLYGLAIDITDRRRAVEALQEADRRKDEFLATLAHELRNPLAPISSGLHILRSAQDDRRSDRSRSRSWSASSTQMVRLVDDLLDVARITTGKVEIRHEPLDLAVAIKDAIETSQPLLAAQGQRVHA